MALAAWIQWFYCVNPALHPALPAGVSQVPAAGPRRPPGLRERCDKAQISPFFTIVLIPVLSPHSSAVPLSFKQAVGQQGLQHRGGGDAGGESCLAERSQPLSDGADSEPNSALAAPHHHRYLHHAAALWHQCCE